MSSSRSDDHEDRPPRRGAVDRDTDQEYLMPASDDIISRVMEIIDSSPGLPMSSSVRVNKEEVLEMLENALDRLPEEVRQAKWLLKDREAFLATREREGEAIVASAAANAGRLVDRREIVKTSRAKAEEIVDEAERTARRRQREADDYCDQQLARYENALAKLLKQVSKMRDRLAAPSIEESELGASSGAAAPAPRAPTNRAQGGPRTGQTRAVKSRPVQPRAGQPRSGKAVSDRPAGEPQPNAPAPQRPGVFDQDG